MNEGLTTTGYDSSAAAAKHSAIECAILDFADEPPIFSTIPLKVSRSSPRCMAGISAPINFTPNFSREPRSYSDIAAFNAVCPPRVAKIAVGFSFKIMASIISGVIGSIYVASANSGSVMIVAGLELIRITRIPSSRRTRQAWVPE